MLKYRKTMSLLLVLAILICLAGCSKNEKTAEQPAEYVESTRDRYEKAQSLLADNRFADAEAVFGDLGSYEDSAMLAMYCHAAAAGESGDYEAALSGFHTLGDYKDSPFMILYFEARQTEAQAAANPAIRWDYLSDAALKYDQLAGFRDSLERAEDCHRKADEAVENLEMSDRFLRYFGEDYMEQGEYQKAAACFDKIRIINEADGVFNADNLLLLGRAYEAAGQADDAAALYEQIYTADPSCSKAYQAHIRILQAGRAVGDLERAASLMKLAYEKTGDRSFETQRQDFIPEPPEASPAAGYYEMKKSITLKSPLGYDIFYTFQEDGRMPYDGIKYTEPIRLEEGIHTLRAVCVNGKLVSDELRATYKIIMPSPQAPQCNLAPNTYKTSQQVKLKPGKDNMNDDDIIIYYTVDGSDPNSDSPVYNGTPVRLANGRVTLKAVAVNRYGKVSNPLEVHYKIEADPKPKPSFTSNDTLDKILPGTTTQLEFFETYGEGEAAGVVQSGDYDTECRRYDYPWGYVIMNLPGKTWVVAEVCFTSPDAPCSAPRDTGIGDSEEYVVSRFRDMGQVESPSHNRGLYFDDNGSGKIWQTEDGYRLIRYTCTEGNRRLQLEYCLQNDRVVRITMKLVP